MGWLRGIRGPWILSPPSPAVMREGAVGLCHFVRVLALLDGVSPVVGCIKQLCREPLGHRFLIALACRRNDPADAQRLPSRGAHFDWYLVGSAAHAARADLDRGHYIVERLLEDVERILFGFGLDRLQRAVDNRLGNRLFAVVHDGVHELGDHDISELRIRNDLALFCGVAAGHWFALSVSSLWLSRLSLRSPKITVAWLRLLWAFCAVLGTALFAILDALRVEYAAQDVVAHAGQILHAAAADHHYRVLLQIVPLAGDVSDHLEAVGEPHLRHFAQGRVRLLRRCRVDARTDTPLLRRGLQCRHGIARLERSAWFGNQLVDRRHSLLSFGLTPGSRASTRKTKRAIRL